MLLKPEDIREIIKLVPERSEPIPGFIPSAILMIFFNNSNQTYLVYIRRTQDMTLHSGQMAFPGGKIDKNDKSSYEAAVRETKEEIGVPETQFNYLGGMGYFHTFVTQYDVAAHLVGCTKPPAYKINELEVAEVVEIPLQVLVQQFQPGLNMNDSRKLLELNFRFRPQNSRNSYILWGLTARITHHFISGFIEFTKLKSQD